MPRIPSDLIKVKPKPSLISSPDGFIDDRIYIAELTWDKDGEAKYEITGVPHLCHCGCQLDYFGFYREQFTVVR